MLRAVEKCGGHAVYHFGNLTCINVVLWLFRRYRWRAVGRPAVAGRWGQVPHPAAFTPS